MSTADELLKAIDTGDLDAVKRMIEQEPSLLKTIIRPGTNRNYSPVTEAAVECQLEILTFLIESGADVTENANYPLQRAALYDRCIPAMEILVQHGADVNSGHCLIAACEGMALSSLEWLLTKGAQITGSAPGRSTATISWNAFSHAGHFNRKRPGMLALLLEHGAHVNTANPDGGDNPGNTALHNVARLADIAGVKLLLEHGADASIKNQAGERPIDRAKNKKVRELLEKSLKKG